VKEPSDFLDYKVDTRSARRAWAPGDYLGKCVDCRQRYLGDKRAYLCADCAYKGWRPTHRYGPSGDTVILREGLVVREGDDTGTVHVIVETMKSAWVVWNREKFQTEFVEI
jgi:hypothetical protein